LRLLGVRVGGLQHVHEAAPKQQAWPADEDD